LNVDPAASALNVVAALRRCRQPVPARVAVDAGRPVRVTTDRMGFAGGAVLACAGPWRTSGDWWTGEAGGAATAGRAGHAGEAGRTGQARGAWDRDEWDVALHDGGVYRIFRDRARDAWFVDAIVD
jgi:protein ImuB